MKNEKRDLMVFGYGLAAIITFFLWRHDRFSGLSVLGWMFWTLAAVLIVTTAFEYWRLRPLYDKWMRVAHFIGAVVTTLILTTIFYVIFGIAGLILRAMKKDLLDTRWPSGRDSYWIPREKKPFDREKYLKQY